MNKQVSIGEVIYNNRKKAGISQEELAVMLDVTRQSISLWETDQTVPSTANLVRLTEIFNISLDELCGKEPKITSPENGEPTNSTCIAQTQTVYDRALLKSMFGAALKKIKVISAVAIAMAVLMIIAIPLSTAPIGTIAFPICFCLLAATFWVVTSVRTKKQIDDDLKLRPNHKITVCFYSDRFEIESISDSSSANYTKLYTDVTKVQQYNGLLLIYYDGFVAPIQSASLGENKDAVCGLLHTAPISTTTDKRVKRLLLSMFVLSILSIELALVACVIALSCSPIPEFSNAMLEYMWLFYVFIPIPIASVTLGAVFLKKTYKCKKNIIAGVIMTALLAIFGSFAPLTGIEVKHDFEFVRNIESELHIELPTDGDISYTLKSNDTITAEAMIKPANKNKTLQMFERDNWLNKHELYPSDIVPIGTHFDTRDYDCFYLYDLDCKQANADISGEHGGHSFVYLAYSQKGNILQIIRFQYGTSK